MTGLDPKKLIEILNTSMAGLPLDSLVTLAAHVGGSRHDSDVPTQYFWRNLSPKWPLLRRVRLAPHAVRGFIGMLLEDKGGCERPLLPSLTELVVVYSSLYALSFLPLCDALMRRVEQGVLVEMLDLRMCSTHEDGRGDGWLRSLCEIVIDVLSPDKTFDFKARDQMDSMWDNVTRGLFVDDENYRKVNETYPISDDADSDYRGSDDWGGQPHCAYRRL